MHIFTYDLHQKQPHSNFRSPVSPMSEENAKKRHMYTPTTYNGRDQNKGIETYGYTLL